MILEGMPLHGLNLIYQIDSNMFQLMGLTLIYCVLLCPSKISAWTTAHLDFINDLPNATKKLKFSLFC